MSHNFKPPDIPALAVNGGIGTSRMLHYIREKGTKNLLGHRLPDFAGGEPLAPLVF